MTREPIYAAIDAERKRQVDKFGNANIGGPLMTDHERLAVIAEEFGEVAREVVDLRWLPLTPEDEAVRRGRLKAELVQLAACAVAWLERMP